MDNVAIFEPIEKTIQNELIDYYSENGLELPNNSLILDYLNWKNPSKIESENTFYAGKVGSKPRKTQPKQNLPKFSLSKAAKEIYSSTENWPQKDHTISDALTNSKDISLNKKRFSDEIKALSLPKEDEIYATKMAEKESSFRPFITNQLGYFGYYQFGKTAMKDVGFTKEDLKNPINQHIALLRYKEKNVKPFEDYVGKVVNGIKLTKNKIAAASHLAGARGLRDWLEGTKHSDFAKRGFIDANGTHITKYLKEF